MPKLEFFLYKHEITAGAQLWKIDYLSCNTWGGDHYTGPGIFPWLMMDMFRQGRLTSPRLFTFSVVTYVWCQSFRIFFNFLTGMPDILNGHARVDDDYAMRVGLARSFGQKNEKTPSHSPPHTHFRRALNANLCQGRRRNHQLCHRQSNSRKLNSNMD